MIAGASSSANALWLTEWLSTAVRLEDTLTYRSDWKKFSYAGSVQFCGPMIF